MRFSAFSRIKPTAPLDMENDTPIVVSSNQHASTSQIEKETTLLRATSNQNSKKEDEKRVMETTPLEEAEALDKLSDEPEYPSGTKL